MAKIKEGATQRIDEAFAKMAPGIQAICVKLRELVHKADPLILEDWKWGPNFNREGMVCGIWGFKNHASITFFKGTVMKDEAGLFNLGEGNDNNRSIKFEDVKEINDKLIIAYIREAVDLNLKGIKPVAKAKIVVVPEDLQDLLAANPRAKEIFDAYAYSHKKEYVDWINDAKRDETRKARLEKTIEMVIEGRTRHDKYK